MGEAKSPVLLACDGVPGAGGLGLQAAFALKAVAQTGAVVALGPGRPAISTESVSWEEVSSPVPEWLARYTPLRWTPGLRTELLDRSIGAASRKRGQQTEVLRGCYAFTGVALEMFEHCEIRGTLRILDSPNGHIRAFREVIDRESQELLGKLDLSHPTRRMVARIEREYQLATKIRVASHWAKRSLVGRGVPETKVHVCDLEVDVERFRPDSSGTTRNDFRVCYVGSVDLRKGVVYLLRALRQLGPGISLRIVGTTGSRALRALVERESSGLSLNMSPGDPIPIYQSSDIFVLPTLEDGFGYVAAEAMACGLPVVVTEACGVSEWVTHGETGWIVPARSAEALATALDAARSKRGDLREMGARARQAILQRMRGRPADTYAAWLEEEYATRVGH
jgi:glycosyltransferase involved in cell wall biosynthesis